MGEVIGDGAGVGVGVGEVGGVGVGLGDGIEVLVLTPVSQTNFFPDLIQVNFLPW